MRQIKYRGLDNLNNWVYGLPTLSTSIGWNPSSIEQYGDQRKYGRTNVVIDKAETITQFIGIKDKNGIEIYEGDYLVDYYPVDEEDESKGMNESLMPVVWCEKQLMWCVDASFAKNGGCLTSLVEYFGEFLEVRGNIYEEQK